jgi:hypothetical protein
MIGISNNRIISYRNGIVRFVYRDRRTNEKKICQLTAIAFARRFILHILPKRFVKIRQFGFLANCKRKTLFPIIRDLVKKKAAIEDEILAEKYLYDLAASYKGTELRCPQCNGLLVFVRDVTSHRALIKTGTS